MGWWWWLPSLPAAWIAFWTVQLWPKRKPAALEEKPDITPREYPRLVPPILHLMDKATGRPICGASIREAWTIVPETATCPECRKQGEMEMLQWYITTR